MKCFEEYEDDAVHAMVKRSGIDYAAECVERGLHTKAVALHYALEDHKHALPMEACVDITLTLDEWDDALDGSDENETQRRTEIIKQLKEGQE